MGISWISWKHSTKTDVHWWYIVMCTLNHHIWCLLQSFTYIWDWKAIGIIFLNLPTDRTQQKLLIIVSKMLGYHFWHRQKLKSKWHSKNWSETVMIISFVTFIFNFKLNVLCCRNLEGGTGAWGGGPSHSGSGGLSRGDNSGLSRVVYS